MLPIRTRLLPLCAALCLAGALAPAQVTKVIDNGPDTGRKVVAVLGDGYAAADQTQFNQDVQRMVTDGVFGRDFFAENHEAFNVYRVNLVSADSGVSQRVYDERGTPLDPSDDVIVSDTFKNTALSYIYSGSWSHCWMEARPGFTSILLRSVLRRHVPNADFVVVILKESRGGGCGGGGMSIVTSGGSWPTVAHEMGHGIGGLADEYDQNQTYTGSPINWPNVSTILSRANVSWGRFIHPSTPIPTTFTPLSLETNRTVGMFEGAFYNNRGVYRPTYNSRMRYNSPDFGPVGYTHMRKQLHAATGQDFSRIQVGDFNRDNRDDVLMYTGTELGVFVAKTTSASTGRKPKLERAWFENNVVPAATGSFPWTLAQNDRFYVGDFDNDGRDDLFVINTVDWPRNYFGMLRSTGSGFQCTSRYSNSVALSWTIAGNDLVYVGDFDGDGKDDVALFNGRDWSSTYLGVFRSDGRRLASVSVHNGSVPGWSMRTNDRHTIGDFDGDGRDDIYVFNGRDWTSKYLGMLRSTGSGLQSVKAYADTLPGWAMATTDWPRAGDIDGDGRSDLYITNTNDWPVAYLMMLRSTGTSLTAIRRYDENSSIPGWAMKKGDRFQVADANADGRADLFVHNTSNWSVDYIGSLRSTGTGLSGTFVSNLVGSYQLSDNDRLLPAGYDGSGAKNGLFVRTATEFGLFRHASPIARLTLDRRYHKWIDLSHYDADPNANSNP